MYPKEAAVYVVREVMNCRPGKVGALIKKFQGISAVAERLGYTPFRLLTDVSGEPFWTVVAETESDSLDGFLEMEARVMAEEEAQQAMAGYHELVVQGRREIFKLEA
jgi:hypothetical protein